MKFSIITVTYNAESTLERTLQSVAQQTYPHVEHLIIDGASKDKTLEIARRYPHAIVHSEPDKGLYDAMNKGLRLATGDYLCFLNAGDTLHSKETLAHIAATCKAEVYQAPCQPSSMVTLTLSMPTDTSCATGVSHPQASHMALLQRRHAGMPSGLLCQPPDSPAL